MRSEPVVALGGNDGRVVATSTTAPVDLSWIPLGAGARVVRFNGVVYEAISAMIQRRPRCPGG